MVDLEGTKPLFMHRIGGINSAIAELTIKVIKNIKEDISKFNIKNTNEQIVFEANYFSSYEGKLVIITPFDASFSFGFIGLSNMQLNSNTLKHEYGHTLQLERMRMVDYIYNVVVPSLTNNLLDRMGKLPYDYYTYPWEAEANQLADVSISQDKPPLPPGGYSSYWDLLKLFFGG